MAFEHVNSLLVADIGNVHTRLVLIDVVEGQYRLIATSRALTTAAPPLSHVGLGVERAADSMARQIGRGLLSLEADQMFIMPEAGGHGVDEFLATSSAGRPMRVFLVGLTPEISIASGRRALAGTYVTLTDTLSTDDLRSEEQKINAILRDEPDLILIVGGTDDGADDILLDLVKTVQKSLLLLTRGKMPVVLFAETALKHQVDIAFASHRSIRAQRGLPWPTSKSFRRRSSCRWCMTITARNRPAASSRSGGTARWASSQPRRA